MEISKIISKVRFRIGDTHEIKFSDYEMIEALNEGNRFFRKLCVDTVPDLITKEIDGTLEAENNVLSVANGLIKITEVRISGRKIFPTITTLVENMTATGTPKYYVPKINNGNVELRLYPVPADALPYSVDYIDEVTDFASGDSVDYPRECIEALMDYIAVRLTNGESAAFETLRERVDTLTNDVVPSPSSVRPYY